MSHTTLRTSLIAAILLALGSGCATTASNGQATTAADQLDQVDETAHGCAVAYPVADQEHAIVVEGFGSAEEEQILVSARQPVARCSKQVVQARQARLHALR